MMRVLVAAALFLAVVPIAIAQPAAPADQLEASLGQQWQAAEVQRQNAAQAVETILEDRRKTKAQLEAERQWWASYVKGLEAKK